MTSASQQNAMMLASLLGVGEDEAAHRLSRTVLVTAERGWKSTWATELVQVLGRTLNVVLDGAACSDFEVVIGSADRRSEGPVLFADLDADGLAIGSTPAALSGSSPHSLYGAAAVCAVAAAAVRTALDAAELPGVRLPARFRFADLGVPVGSLARPIVLKDAFVAGAGAVAHGFLRAARHLDLRGELAIVDPKVVKDGVLNRCLYLGAEDVGVDKAVALVERARVDFGSLRLYTEVRDLRDVLRGRALPPEWVFVTVDSREVRRSIQGEMPHRIVDASTTDVREVIVHSNVQPTDRACLACIYPHVPEEHARERAIAESLGVDLDTVRRGYIDADAARLIRGRYPQIESDAIVGTAFDSLFRQMCGERAMTTPEGRQVLAPFAFVSAWAGVLMAVELLRVSHGGFDTNYWRVDPWNSPVARSRTSRGRLAGCRFCSQPGIDDLARSFGW